MLNLSEQAVNLNGGTSHTHTHIHTRTISQIHCYKVTVNCESYIQVTQVWKSACIEIEPLQ